MTNSDYLLKAAIKKVTEKLNELVIEKIEEATNIAQDGPEIIKKEFDTLKEAIIEEAARMEKEGGKSRNTDKAEPNQDKNLNEVLKQGDLCITRAGASSLAELSFLNIPFIAIPLPSSKDNHQYENAKYYEEQDCCWIINQKNFDDQKFEKFLLELTNKSQDYMTKKNNLQKLNYQNTWNNVNQKILKIINEN